MADTSADLASRPARTLRRFILGLWNAPVFRALRMAVEINGWRTSVVVVLLILGAVLPAVEMLALGGLVGSLPATVKAGLSSAAGHRTEQALGLWAVLMLLLQVAPQVRAALVTGMG